MRLAPRLAPRLTRWLPGWLTAGLTAGLIAGLAASLVLSGAPLGLGARIASGMTATNDALAPLETYVWQRDEPEFGGFSALALTGDGSRMIALTDRGHAYTADILRQPAAKAGGIRDLVNTAQLHLRDPKGKVLRPYLADAEDMALAPDGSLYVAFESYGRILHYPGLAATPVWTHRWNQFEPRFGNQGFEALVALPQDRLLAIAETALPGVDKGIDPPAFCRDATGWHSAFTVPDPQGFAISGADIGPDGKLYLLERKVAWMRGFSTRIRRFSLNAAAGPHMPCGLRLGASETVLHTPFGALDNMEGISLWQSDSGQTILTLISDDNFSWFQGTILKEYVVMR